MTRTAWAMVPVLAMIGAPAIAADLPMLATTPVPSPTSFLDGVYLHVGAAGIIPDAGAKIYTPLGRIPGATIRVPPQVTASVEIGYRFTPNWAISVSGGVPPSADVYGAGTLAPYGKLGSGTYGPVSVTGHYHVTAFGAFQPYIGLGPAYMIAFDSRDAVLTNFQVRSAWGAVGQVGADYMFSDHLGVFVDYKKAYLRTDAVATLGPTPLVANVKLDPSVVSGGLTFRF